MGLKENEADKLRKRTWKYMNKKQRVTSYRICKDIDINLSTLPRFMSGKGMEYNNMVKLDNYLELKGY